MFSVLNVYKPPGPTSHDVVAILRRVYGLKKIGHLGTLDPLAEGVLPICLGRATRLIEYFDTDKRYRAAITFGRTTETLDGEGEILSETSAAHLTRAQIEAALAPFRGEIEQLVPRHSAVHVKGKKLYKYAHQGIEPSEIPTRKTTIYALDLEDWQTDDPDHPVAVLDIHCSSGTYVRALARDLGDALGTGAYLSHLIRTQHGQFRSEDAAPLEDITGSSIPIKWLQDPLPYLGLPVIHLASEQRFQQLCHGIPLRVEPEDGLIKSNGRYAVLYGAEGLVAIVEAVSQRLKPLKVFAETSVVVGAGEML